MINFLRISNNIELGNYLHSNGAIDNIPSSDIIGVCVIPSNFLPDKSARFMSLKRIVSTWGEISKLNTKHKKTLPSIDKIELKWGRLDGRNPALISPYLSDGSFNLDFLKDLPNGNAFQDYKGYENTKIYKEKYKNLGYPNNVFSSCFKISPQYRKSEWYLPSIGELALLFEKKSLVNSTIIAGSGIVLSANGYWSSSEWDSENAWYVYMGNGYVDNYSKDCCGHVRPFLTL